AAQPAGAPRVEEEERDANVLFAQSPVLEAAMLAELFAVVARHHDHRAPEEVAALEVSEQTLEEAVRIDHVPLVERPQPRQVRAVGGCELRAARGGERPA